MSVAALKDLIDRLETSVREDVGKKADDKAVKVFRRTDTNRYANAFRFSKADFKFQVIDQIKRSGINLSPLDTALVGSLCRKYYEKIAFQIITKQKQNKKVELIIGQDEVTIISFDKRDLSNFDALGQQTTGSKAKLRQDILNPFMNELNTLLATMKKKKLKGSFSDNFNLGHQEGSNVQYFIAGQLEKSLRETAGVDEQLREAILQDIDIGLQSSGLTSVRETERSVVIQALSKFHNKNLSDLGKTIVLSIESKIGNTSKEEDRGVREALIVGLRRFVNNRPVAEWVNQESSDSIVRASAKSILQSGVKAGFKTNDKSLLRAINSQSGEAKKSRKNKDKDIISNKRVAVNVVKSRSTNRQAAFSYISLINLINVKLPPKIRSNMGEPRLVNRTGTFSETAKVTNIVPTAQGYPSIEYDYQKTPYGVFDKKLGKSPWNTPGRDPNALVDLSVRQIAREIGLTRFFTRRRG